MSGGISIRRGVSSVPRRTGPSWDSDFIWQGADHGGPYLYPLLAITRRAIQEFALMSGRLDFIIFGELNTQHADRECHQERPRHQCCTPPILSVQYPGITRGIRTPHRTSFQTVLPRMPGPTRCRTKWSRGEEGSVPEPESR